MMYKIEFINKALERATGKKVIEHPNKSTHHWKSLCPLCNNEVTIGMNYCDQCGQALIHNVK